MASPFSDSIADCRQLAKYFDYTFYSIGDDAGTILYRYESVQNPGQMYETYQCTNMTTNCPDGTLKTTCFWQRVLGLWCLPPTQNNKNTRIRVATNSLPNHCYQSNSSYPLGSDQPITQ
eukprot:403333662